MTSVVLVDNSGTVVEYVDDGREAETYPTVVVEEVPGAILSEEPGYSAQVVVYGDETYIMQEVSSEQDVESERGAGETSLLLC
uniref:Transcription factor Elf N-terminal domain-containing protein n=1 Tax=Hippocampus comes TaxID=109280 RepID=A0A3Q2YUP6_HIPCM